MLTQLNFLISFYPPIMIQDLIQRRAIQKVIQPVVKNNFANVNWCDHTNARILMRVYVRHTNMHFKKGLYARYLCSRAHSAYCATKGYFVYKNHDSSSNSAPRNLESHSPGNQKITLQMLTAVTLTIQTRAF